MSGPTFSPNATSTEQSAVLKAAKINRECSAADLEHDQARDVHAGAGEGRGNRPQRKERVSEKLRTRSEQRRNRGLVDIAPLRVKTANDEVQLVAEKSVMRIGCEVKNKRQQPRGDR